MLRPKAHASRSPTRAHAAVQIMLLLALGSLLAPACGASTSSGGNGGGGGGKSTGSGPCLGAAEPCAHDGDCCGGACNTAGFCCLALGAKCDTDNQCCDGTSCIDGACATCSSSDTCSVDSDCCAGRCESGNCCLSEGAACGDSTDCCGAYYQGAKLQGFQCANQVCRSCVAPKSACSTDADCCESAVESDEPISKCGSGGTCCLENSVNAQEHYLGAGACCSGTADSLGFCCVPNLPCQTDLDCSPPACYDTFCGPNHTCVTQ